MTDRLSQMSQKDIRYDSYTIMIVKDGIEYLMYDGASPLKVLSRKLPFMNYYYDSSGLITEDKVTKFKGCSYYGLYHFEENKSSFTSEKKIQLSFYDAIHAAKSVKFIISNMKVYIYGMNEHKISKEPIYEMNNQSIYYTTPQKMRPFHIVIVEEFYENTTLGYEATFMDFLVSGTYKNYDMVFDSEFGKSVKIGFQRAKSFGIMNFNASKVCNWITSFLKEHPLTEYEFEQSFIEIRLGLHDEVKIMASTPSDAILLNDIGFDLYALYNLVHHHWSYNSIRPIKCNKGDR